MNSVKAHNMAQPLAWQAQTAPSSSVRTSGQAPFFEVKFMRLHAFEECQKHVRLLGSSAVGNQIFQRYTLPFMSGVSMDFCCRGKKVKNKTAAAFAQLLSHTGPVSTNSLNKIAEVMADHWQDPTADTNEVVNAEVGNLNGNHTLAIEWIDFRRNLRWISVYLDGYGDGKTVREIHFCAPRAKFEMAKKHFSEVLRSIQWNLRSEKDMQAASNVFYMNH